MTKHSLKRKYCRNNMSKKILTIINTKIDLVQDTLNTLVKKSENEVSVSPPETYQSELANSKESELVIPPTASGIYEPKSPEGTPPPLSDVSSLTTSDVSTTPEPETDVSTTTPVSDNDTYTTTTPVPETDAFTTTPVSNNDAFTTTSPVPENDASTTTTPLPENDAFTTTTTTDETSVPETSVSSDTSEQKKGGKRRTHKRRNNNKNKSNNRRR